MTAFVDRTQEPDEVFEREVLARVGDPSLTPAPSSPVALLDQLDELRAKATPGPWVHMLAHDSGASVASARTGDLVADRIDTADAALIVVAVNALPELLAELRKRDAAVRAVLELCEQMEREAPKPQVGGFMAEEFRRVVTAALSVTS